MKSGIVVLMAVFALHSSWADISAQPTYEQAIRLAEAAWKSPPQNIDVTYYYTVKDNTKTEEKIRQMFKRVFDNEYGSDDSLSSNMLERKRRDIQSNVDTQLAEQRQGGIKIKLRVRCDGKNYRVDKVYGEPDRTVLKGTAHEKFLKGKKLDASTPYEQTFIEQQISPNDLELYIYYHSVRVATIEKIKHNRAAVRDRNIYSILRFPNSFILKTNLGDPMNDPWAGEYDINEPKIRRLCHGTLEGIRVKVTPDQNEPNTRDRIEISLYDKENVEDYTSLMICSKDDYSKVYYCQTSDPAVSKFPLFTRTCRQFDAQGFPHQATVVHYDGKGNVLRHEIYQIENIHVNIPIPKEVFEFHPPEGYDVKDYRITPAERQTAEIARKIRWLKDKDWTRRARALIDLEKSLKDNPAQLKELVTPLLDDERPDIRRMATIILRRIDTKQQEEK